MLTSPSSPQIAIGELLWDMLPSGPRLGGATTNFAVLSARLGEYSSLISCLGDDGLGREAMGRLAALAQDTSLSLSGVQTSASLPTGTVSVTLDEEGRPKYVINSPVAWDAISLVPRLIGLAGTAAVIYFGTLAQRDEVSRASMRAVVGAAGTECTRMCDLNLRIPFCTEEVLRWSIAHADVLKVSDEELSEVGQMLGNAVISRGLRAAVDSETLSEAAIGCASELLMLAPQCKLVAITLGPYGSLLMDRRGSFRHRGYVVKVVDTIGAGDAFTAGLVHAYLQGATLEGISAVANRCGSFVASQSGATPKIPEELRGEIEEMVGR
ncbi:fructokinase [Granulicella aggregans]|uniref:Fructokinase n=1 Tax=Granulicella aggregans TaxID=474949 RepID=A0A7W7ZBZ4_9BACT|nr:PfkB family carbohydrate kinase [Granulicella aggregans]MBB5056953.1 fructokinase [Granulicella aggregans]